MRFTPRALLRVAVLAYFPCTFAIDLQTGALDHKVDRFAVVKDRQFDIKRFYPVTEDSVIRHRKVWEGQIAQTVCETLQGTQGPSIDGLHAQQFLRHSIILYRHGRLRVGMASGMLARTAASIHIVMFLPLFDQALL
ncbi:MAG: hypothetical protein E5299_01245 [Burkholderia gladioli]|nr:MAG: hypothetical protein E5299_01245 [Burkholderia gladioli]